MLSKSTNGRVRWSAPHKVSDSPSGVEAFTPSVHVNSADDKPDTGTALTDYWFRASTTVARASRPRSG